MVIEKNGKYYTATETSSKWTVKTENGKVSVFFEVPKDLCKTEDELREYVLTNDELF